MDSHALALALRGPQPPLLLHVLPPEHFAARRIEGSKNACVYEVAFLGAVRAMSPDAALPIVVYGEGAPSLDSEEAARVLRHAGYSDVRDFRGGLREWESAGLPVAGDAPLPSPAQPEGIYEADAETSVIRWTGRNLFNHHGGYLRLRGGEVEWRGGAIRRAEFTVDLGSIVCEDLTDPGVHAALVAHLRSADFFDADAHPFARFESTRIDSLSNATEGTPTHQVAGRFTLRGVAQEIEFPAVIAAADADHVTAQAQFEIDRTRWGSLYGSGKFFAFLGRHVVNDAIALHLKVHASRQLTSS